MIIGALDQLWFFVLHVMCVWCSVPKILILLLFGVVCSRALVRSRRESSRVVRVIFSGVILVS